MSSNTQHDAAEHFRKEADALLERHPEWKDARKAQADLEALRDDLVKHFGYSREHVERFAHPRNVEVALDAIKFRKQEAERKKQREAEARSKDKRDSTAAMKDKLAKARGNFGARAEIIADHLGDE